MNYIYLVAILAIAQYLYFGFMVGKARGQFGVKAPAVTGHEGFERAFRVQMNTMEQLVAFLPALFIAGHYFPGYITAGVGAVYLVGRFIYRRSYIADPATRGTGFILTILPTFVLLIFGIVGFIRFW